MRTSRSRSGCRNTVILRMSPGIRRGSGRGPVFGAGAAVSDAGGTNGCTIRGCRISGAGLSQAARSRSAGMMLYLMARMYDPTVRRLPRLEQPSRVDDVNSLNLTGGIGTRKEQTMFGFGNGPKDQKKPGRPPARAKMVDVPGLLRQASQQFRIRDLLRMGKREITILSREKVDELIQRSVRAAV